MMRSKSIIFDLLKPQTGRIVIKLMGEPTKKTRPRLNVSNLTITAFIKPRTINKQQGRWGTTCALPLNRAPPQILSRSQINARRLKSATAKVHLIETYQQEVNHE
jgi:hypothetical protein